MVFLKLVDHFNKTSIYFSYPKTWVMWAIIDLHDYLMFFLINIFIIVIIFLFYCLLYRYKILHINSGYLRGHVLHKIEDVNHGPWLEFYWTMIPIVLLFLMGWPSFRVLYAMEQLIDPFHTIVIIGNQWYRTYQYSDFDVTFDMIFQLDSDLFLEYKKDAIKNIETDSYLIKKVGINKYVNFTQFIQLVGKHFRNYEESQIIYDSVIIPEENLPLGYPRLLSVDQVLVLPCNISIRLLVTSADVIHSWALPSHGIKMDAIPGRINQIPFLCNFWGTYWGQCSELCGINHGFMPIEVRVVPFEDYMVYLKLNLAFRYEKFQPMLVNFFSAYVNHLKYMAEKDLYTSISDAIFNSDELSFDEYSETLDSALFSKFPKNEALEIINPLTLEQEEELIEFLNQLKGQVELISLTHRDEILQNFEAYGKVFSSVNMDNTLESVESFSVSENDFTDVTNADFGMLKFWNEFDRKIPGHYIIWDHCTGGIFLAEMPKDGNAVIEVGQSRYIRLPVWEGRMVQLAGIFGEDIHYVMADSWTGADRIYEAEQAGYKGQFVSILKSRYIRLKPNLFHGYCPIIDTVDPELSVDRITYASVIAKSILSFLYDKPHIEVLIKIEPRYLVFLIHDTITGEYTKVWLWTRFERVVEEGAYDFISNAEKALIKYYEGS